MEGKPFMHFQYAVSYAIISLHPRFCLVQLFAVSSALLAEITWRWVPFGDDFSDKQLDNICCLQRRQCGSLISLSISPLCMPCDLEVTCQLFSFDQPFLFMLIKGLIYCTTGLLCWHMSAQCLSPQHPDFGCFSNTTRTETVKNRNSCIYIFG